MRFAFVEEHAEQFDVDAMCRMLEVSRSGYYAWRQRPLSRRAREDRQLLPKIRAIHQQTRQSYGSPRIHRELQGLGVECGRHRVARVTRSGPPCQAQAAFPRNDGLSPLASGGAESTKARVHRH